MIGLFEISAGRWLISALAAIVVLAATYFVADHRGYQRASTAYTATIAQMQSDAATARADEIERQDTANNAAKAAETQRIAQMQAENQSLQDQIEELQREADQDPDAGKPALGASSVHRINQIR